MLISIGNFIILQQLGHLIFAEFGNFSFSFCFFPGILKNNHFLPTWPLTYGAAIVGSRQKGGCFPLAGRKPVHG